GRAAEKVTCDFCGGRLWAAAPTGCEIARGIKKKLLHFAKQYDIIPLLYYQSHHEQRRCHHG
ncbi:MAG: hypothetical protein FWC27_04990, partial [Firmicutes bacterium]|nr:hypothetical protein [Bacillota bacterium]